MFHSFRLAAAASVLLSLSAVQGHAESKVVINRDVLRQMVQLSVAFTQARISYTSPPYPVQFANTTPFAATAQNRTLASQEPIVRPTAHDDTNPSKGNYLLTLAKGLAPGNYNIVATTSSFSLTPLATGRPTTGTIPASVAPFLPSQSGMGSVTVASIKSAGNVNVTYTFKR